jgi:hypothetical protein
MEDSPKGNWRGDLGVEEGEKGRGFRMRDTQRETKTKTSKEVFINL